MDNYELDCDIETIFVNTEEEEKYFKRLSAYLYDFRTKTINSIEKEFNNYRESANKLKENVETLAQLSEEAKEIEANIDSVVLQQKILMKKITNSISVEEALKENIAISKARREALTLEMVDLQHELTKQKEMKKKEWDAIKAAIAIYKKRLRIHIDVQHQEESDAVTVFFFDGQNSNRDNYYVLLTNSNNSWKVSNIQPPLADKYLNELNLDLSRKYERLDIIRFLCGIRSTFIKYYLKNE